MQKCPLISTYTETIDSRVTIYAETLIPLLLYVLYQSSAQRTNSENLLQPKIYIYEVHMLKPSRKS